jgi:branched-chain amino acid transport system ATP-binding protein
MLSGLHAPSSGSVIFEGRDITNVKAHEFSSLGISHVPEGRRIFGRMTVEENLEMGAFARRGSLTRRHRRDLRDVSDPEGPSQAVGREPLGRRAADAGHRARPDVEAPLLLLDEPSMGLAPMIIQQIFRSSSQIREKARPSSWWSRTPQQALRLADRGYVMENGASSSVIGTGGVRRRPLEGPARARGLPRRVPSTNCARSGGDERLKSKLRVRRGR